MISRTPAPVGSYMVEMVPEYGVIALEYSLEQMQKMITLGGPTSQSGGEPSVAGIFWGEQEEEISSRGIPRTPLRPDTASSSSLPGVARSLPTGSRIV